ncbi:MAG: hypothetical protein HY561_08300 [Gemmatimonadetes bacterium]|nr:hypothetical protein [Gemmatimonadota bacterium]
MRTALLPLLLPVAACGAAGAPAPDFIADFVSRSNPVTCVPVPGTNPGRAVSEMSSVDDTSFLVLYADAAEVAWHGPDLRVRWAVPLPSSGAGRIIQPQSAALAGDSLVYVADRGRLNLRAFDLAGNERGTIELGFPPQRVRVRGRELLVTPVVFGRNPPHLLYTLAAGTTAAPAPLPVPVAHYADFAIKGLANLTVLETFHDGRAIVAHQFLFPHAYLFSWGDAAVPRRVPLPLPDGVRADVDFVPEMPVTDAVLERMVTPVIASAVDHRTGDFLYITRSGRRVRDFLEKAIVRLDRQLRYRRSYLLNVNAIHHAYLPGRAVSIVVDDLNRWYECLTP